MVDPIRPDGPLRSRLPPTTDPLAGLAADVPIVLLPVRVETRWFTTSDPARLELRIRVYPDEIHVAAPLSATRAERADVAAYHALLARDGEDAPTTRARYAQLVERHGSSRAAWLVRALAPGAPAIADANDDEAAVRVAGLPDHWIAVAKAPGFRAVATGTPIVADLAAAPVPNDTHDDPNTPALGNALAWVTDFAAAEAAGMALRLVMKRADAERLDELCVLGVSAEDPERSAAHFGELLSRHASSSGAALLAWGTPTNTTGDRDAARATGERGGWSGPGARPLTAIGDTPTGDSARTLAALGVDGAHARDLVADGIDRDAISRAMHVALWPATWGYYLDELAGQPADAVARARSLYVEHVRPAGPYPTLRVRAQPYGLLPTTSLARWPAATERGCLAAFLARVERLVGAAVARVPRLVDTTDVDRDLVAVLRRLPASRGAWVRQVTDVDTAAVSLGGDPFGWVAKIQAEVERLARTVISAQLGLPTTMRAVNLVYDDAAALLGIPFVAPSGASPDEALPQDYLSALATASASDIAAHRIPGADPRTLLYLLARHATTLIRLASSPPRPIIAIVETRGVGEVRDHPSTRPAPTPPPTAVSVWNRLDVVHAHAFANPAVIAHQHALRTLGAAPVRELEHTLAGVIDSSAYRVDAWATALASERLAALRAARPSATHIGGWAWLEKPRPSPRPAAGGFVHAPSLAQARTAAVLRAGYEAHRADGAGSTLEVDVSSKRVRAARWLLGGLRNGRPIGRLLGDHLERLLIDRGHPELVGDVRRSSVPAGAPLPDLADGWKLYHDWSAHAPGGPLGDAFEDLRALLDAVADLLVAECVHQALAGSPARAAAALDALERGEIATPDPQVDRTATDGRRIQRRVALLLGPAPGWPGETRPRAAAEPALEGLAARVLGQPNRVAIDVSVERDGATSTVSRTLADLDLCALDAVILAGEGERAFLDRAAASVVDGGTVRAVTGGPALDELVLRGAALARMFRAAHTPRAGELGGVTVNALPERDRPTTDIALDTLARPAPIGALTPLAAVASSPAELATWLGDMARVRPALEPLDLLALVAPDVFRGERRRTDDGVELALFATTNGAPTTALVVDGWSEAPPAGEITTGAAFPFDAPRAQPPQSILLAVPPPSVRWTLPLLEAIVDETIARAKLRVVAPDDVRGQLAPALLVADSRDELVPSVDLIQHAFVLEEVVQ